MGRINIISKLNTCNHQFCFDCIKKWEKRKKICPLCRAPFSFFTNFRNQNSELINIGNKNEKIESLSPNNICPKSLKLPILEICYICGKYGTNSSVFTCQICKKYKAHYWCENLENFNLGIYICSSCLKLRKQRLNEI